MVNALVSVDQVDNASASRWVPVGGNHTRRLVDHKVLVALCLDPVAVDQNGLCVNVGARAKFRRGFPILSTQPKANGMTMRGFALRPHLPSYEEVYGLRAGAIAVYPMYKGLARLVGMTVIGQPSTLDEQMELLREHWNSYDFFFVHFKYTDSTGEDGDFDAKVKRIEQFDAAMPKVNELNPDVLIVTGDHSTPSFLRSHSWHAVPTLLVSDCCRPDRTDQFSESACIGGGLGQFEAKHLMTLAMANARRLSKFGA